MIDPYGDALPAGVIARLGSGRLMHPSLVNDIVFSPDGALIASCADDVRVWDAATGKLVHRLVGGKGGFARVAFSPDGATVAAVSKGATLWFWDVASGALRNKASLDHHEGRAVGYAGERLIVVGAYTNVLVFSHKGKRLCQFEECKGWVKDLACDVARGRVYVATERDLWRFALPTKRLLSWATPDAAAHKQLHDGDGSAVALSADGTRLVSSSYEKVTVWAIDANGEERVEHAFDVSGQAQRICISPDGKRLLSAGRDGAQLWTMGGELLHTFAENHYGVDVAVYAPSGQTLATGARGGDVRIWNSDGTAEVIEFPRNRSNIESMAISPDASRVVTVSGVKTLHVWDGNTGAELRAVPANRHTGTQVAYAPTGAFFAHAQDDGRIVLYDGEGVATGAVLTTKEKSGWFRSLVVAPDGQHVVGCKGDSELFCWAIGEPRPIWTKALGSGHYATLRISPDGKVLAVCDGNAISLWDFPRGEKRRTVGALVFGAGFVDSDTIIGFCTDSFARTWSVATGEELSQRWYPAGAAIVSPTGKFAAFQRDDDTEFRALPGLELLGTRPTGYWGYGAGFSADGTRFLGAFEARSVLVWDIADIVSARPGPTPVYPGAAALAAYKLILEVLPTETFEGVRIGDACTHAASPESDDFEFLGIIIHLPARGRILSERDQTVAARNFIDPPSSPLVPMAGYISVSGNADLDNVYIVAVDQKTNARYRGRLIMRRPTSAHESPPPIYDDDPSADDPFVDDPSVDDPTYTDGPDVADVSSDYRTGSWFTINLSEQIGLPDRRAVYSIHLEHAVVESLRSNAVRVEIS